MVIFNSYVSLPEGILQFWTKTNPEGSGNFMEICFSWSSSFFLNLRSFSNGRGSIVSILLGETKANVVAPHVFLTWEKIINHPSGICIYIYIICMYILKKYLTTYKHGEIGDGLWHCFTTIHGFCKCGWCQQARHRNRISGTLPIAPIEASARWWSGGFSPNPSEKWWSEFVSWDDEIPNVYIYMIINIYIYIIWRKQMMEWKSIGICWDHEIPKWMEKHVPNVPNHQASNGSYLKVGIA